MDIYMVSWLLSKAKLPIATKHYERQAAFVTPARTARILSIRSQCLDYFDPGKLIMHYITFSIKKLIPVSATCMTKKSEISTHLLFVSFSVKASSHVP